MMQPLKSYNVVEDQVQWTILFPSYFPAAEKKSNLSNEIARKEGSVQKNSPYMNVNDAM